MALKVLQIVKTAVGASWAYHQVRVLCSLGIEIVVALPSETEGLAPLYRKAGAEVVRADVDFPARRPWLLPARLRACRELVRRVQPDLIHTHHVGPTLIVRMALGKKSPVPRLFQVPGPLHLEHQPFVALELQTAGPQDHWVATCKWTQKRYYDLGISANRLFLSYYGTDLKPFQGMRTGLLRKELGISCEIPLVGMVSYIYAPKWFLGQVRGLKGHEDFFAAFRRVSKIKHEARGVVIGGAWGNAQWYERRLRRLGSEVCNGSLTFLGTRTDVPVLYPDLDLAVVASHSEGTGGVVEPLLSGVPVVATNVGGLPEIVMAGKTGWLVPPRKPVMLAEAILESLTNRAEARRRAVDGQRLASSLFNVEQTGREIADVYSKVLGAPLSSRPPGHASD